MNDDELYLEQLLKEYNKDILKIASDCKKLLHEALMDTVFSYSPTVYNRTGQLEDINNIKVDILNDTAYIYFDTDNMKYYSFGKGLGYDNSNLESVSADKILHFLEVGHDTSSPYEGSVDMFNHYPAQHFLELAQQKIKAKYPELSIEIIRDQPIL